MARWLFNEEGVGTLLVTRDGEGVCFDGALSDVWIEIDGRRVPWSPGGVSSSEEQASTAPSENGLEATFPVLTSGTSGFTATQTGGPDVDLVALAGLKLNDIQSDRLLDHPDWETIVNECGGQAIAIEEFEGGPGQSDTFYDVEVDDPPRFLALLRKILWAQANGENPW